MRRHATEDLFHTAVGPLALMVLVGALLWAPPVQAQGGGIEQIHVDLGLVGMSSLGTIYPSMVYRPFDDMTVRPGGRAAGMGGAYLAQAEGPLAIGWEPAGLATLKRTALVVDGYSTSSSATIPDYPDSFIVPQSPPLLLSSYSVNLKGGLRSNFIAAGTPLWDNGTQRFVGAVSWRRYHDVSMPEETISDLVFGEAGGFPVVITTDRVEKGAVESFAPSFAMQIVPGVAVGANLNFLTGRLRTSSSQRLATGGFPFEAVTRLNFKYSGFVPDFGVRLAGLQDRVRIGVLFTPGYTLKVRGGDLYSESLPAPGTPQFIVQARVPGYDMEVPSAFGAGISVQAGDRLLFAADFNSRSWGESTINYVETPDDPVSAANNKLPLRDVSSFHIGAEYMLFRPSWAEIPVRVGYRLAPQSFADVSRSDVVVDSTFYPLLAVSSSGEFNGDQVDGSAFSLGASLWMGATDFDFGFEVLSYEVQKWFFDAPYDPIVNQDMTLVSVDRTVTRFRISATQRF